MTDESGEPFAVRMEVRSYEIDPQLHVSGPAYVRYADHSSFACVQAAGIDVAELPADGMGPVNLETGARYHSELRGGDETTVTCDWTWGDGKTYRVEHEIRRADGKLAAEVQHVSGLLDLQSRHLVPDPAAEWRAWAKKPELVGFR